MSYDYESITFEGSCYLPMIADKAKVLKSRDPEGFHHIQQYKDDLQDLVETTMVEQMGLKSSGLRYCVGVHDDFHSQKEGIPEAEFKVGPFEITTDYDFSTGQSDYVGDDGYEQLCKALGSEFVKEVEWEDEEGTRSASSPSSGSSYMGSMTIAKDDF